MISRDVDSSKISNSGTLFLTDRKFILRVGTDYHGGVIIATMNNLTNAEVLIAKQ
jgi:hypothetical protein